MQVVAFCIPGRTDWHWRIVNYSGDTLEESHETFPSIAAALASGSRRLEQMNAPERALPPAHVRTTSPFNRPVRSARP